MRCIYFTRPPGFLLFPSHDNKQQRGLTPSGGAMIVLASHWSEMINTQLLLADHEWPRPPRYDIICTQHPAKKLGDNNLYLRGDQISTAVERLEQFDTASIMLSNKKYRSHRKSPVCQKSSQTLPCGLYTWTSIQPRFFRA